MKNWTLAIAVVLAISPALAIAKSNKLMQPAAVQGAPAIESGKAMLVLMRPSYYGGAVAASVYDVTGGEIRFIGVLGPKDNIAHQVGPGARRFMVVAENADFMEATLEAGKTYHAVVRARPGVWKARFSLIPMQSESNDQYNLQSADFKQWIAASEWVESTPRALAWFEENRASIEDKHKSYLVKWDAMLPADKAELTMGTEDGIASP